MILGKIIPKIPQKTAPPKDHKNNRRKPISCAINNVTINVSQKPPINPTIAPLTLSFLVTGLCHQSLIVSNKNLIIS